MKGQTMIFPVIIPHEEVVSKYRIVKFRANDKAKVEKKILEWAKERFKNPRIEGKRIVYERLYPFSVGAFFAGAVLLPLFTLFAVVAIRSFELMNLVNIIVLPLIIAGIIGLAWGSTSLDYDKIRWSINDDFMNVQLAVTNGSLWAENFIDFMTKEASR